jgi:hypothetical protein
MEWVLAQPIWVKVTLTVLKRSSVLFIKECDELCIKFFLARLLPQHTQVLQYLSDNILQSQFVQALDVCLHKMEEIPCNNYIRKDVLEVIRKCLLKIQEEVLGIHHSVGDLFYSL